MYLPGETTILLLHSNSRFMYCTVLYCTVFYLEEPPSCCCTLVLTQEYQHHTFSVPNHQYFPTFSLSSVNQFWRYRNSLIFTLSLALSVFMCRQQLISCSWLSLRYKHIRYRVGSLRDNKGKLQVCIELRSTQYRFYSVTY